MDTLKRYTGWLAALLVIIVLGCAGVFVFFYRMGHNDAQILAGFPAAYRQYDQAAAAFSTAVLAASPGSPSAAPSLEQQADSALAGLQTRASARISSLTRHDGDLMQIMQDIAALSAQELSALKAYEKTPTDRGRLAKDLSALQARRQVDFARFQQLARE